jgi:serine acetyltransferase
VKIGNDCFIGAGVIIMPGVKVGDRCIVGAGTVLTKCVPTGSIVAGNPGRLIGRFGDFEERVRGMPSEADLAGTIDFRTRVTMAIDPTPRKSL